MCPMVGNCSDCEGTCVITTSEHVTVATKNKVPVEW